MWTGSKLSRFETTSRRWISLIPFNSLNRFRFCSVNAQRVRNRFRTGLNLLVWTGHVCVCVCLCVSVCVHALTLHVLNTRYVNCFQMFPSHMHPHSNIYKQNRGHSGVFSSTFSVWIVGFMKLWVTCRKGPLPIVVFASGTVTASPPAIGHNSIPDILQRLPLVADGNLQHQHPQTCLQLTKWSKL